jgi:uncharacterized protein (TIGR03000 family)
MRLTGIKAAICASVVALATATSASAGWWPGYYGSGSGYGGYSPYYYNAGNYYGYSPYWNSYYSYYPYFSTYYPYYSSYSYPAYYTYSPTYTVPTTVATVPTTSSYQSFYPSERAVSPPAGDEAVVVVRTDPSARLWFDGVLTSQTGTIRTFGTPELKPGKTFKYDVKVRWMENGVPVDRSRTISVGAGEKVVVDLTPANLRNE